VCRNLDRKLRATIGQPDEELLREDPKYQIVNEFYGTFAEQIISRTYFSHIKVQDPLRFKRYEQLKRARRRVG
jgi:hypothetical protein